MNKIQKKYLEKILDNYMDTPIDDDKLDGIYSRIKNKLEENDPAQSKLFTKKKGRKSIFNRIGIVAACVIGFFILIIAVPSMPQVQAFRFDIEKNFYQLFHPTEEIYQDGIVAVHYSNIDEINKDLEIKLPKFNWIPEGLELSDISALKDINNKFRTVNYNYTNASGEDIIDIGIIYFGDDIAHSQFNSSSEFYEYSFKDMKIALSKDSPYNAHFYYNNQYLVSVTTSLDKDNLLKFIENIE